jgi:hypothetical protein
MKKNWPISYLAALLRAAGKLRYLSSYWIILLLNTPRAVTDKPSDLDGDGPIRYESTEYMISDHAGQAKVADGGV